jgi:hypothetical protein
MAFLATCLFILGLVWVGPETALRRTLHRWLVERPAERLAADPLWAAARLLAILAVVGIAMGAPELLVVFGMVDVTVMMEFALFATLVIGLVQLRGLRAQASLGLKAFARLVEAMAPRARRRAPRRQAGPSRRNLADNDDEPLPVLLRRAA